MQVAGVIGHHCEVISIDCRAAVVPGVQAVREASVRTGARVRPRGAIGGVVQGRKIMNSTGECVRVPLDRAAVYLS